MPMSAKGEQYPPLFWRRSTLLILLLLSWACIAGRITLIFIPLFLLAAVVLALFWKSKIFTAILLLNPMTLAFVLGASEWNSERPAFVGNGLPNHEAQNLDRNTRCYRSIGGCVVYGGEWVYNDSHNAGLKLMTVAFGPPPKTYHGPYPTLAEATNATINVTLVSPEEFEAGKFKVDERVIELGKEKTSDLLFDLGLVIATESGVQIRTAIWQKDCLIVHVQKPGFREEPSTEVNGIYLFQINGMKPIARYQIGKTHGPRLPKLLRR